MSSPNLLRHFYKRPFVFTNRPKYPLVLYQSARNFTKIKWSRYVYTTMAVSAGALVCRSIFVNNQLEGRLKENIKENMKYYNYYIMSMMKSIIDDINKIQTTQFTEKDLNDIKDAINFIEAKIPYILDNKSSDQKQDIQYELDSLEKKIIHIEKCHSKMKPFEIKNELVAIEEIIYCIIKSIPLLPEKRGF